MVASAGWAGQLWLWSSPGNTQGLRLHSLPRKPLPPLHYLPSENIFCNVQAEPSVCGYSCMLYHLPPLRGVWFSHLLLTCQNTHWSQHVLNPALSSTYRQVFHHRLNSGLSRRILSFCPYVIGNDFQEHMLHHLSRDWDEPHLFTVPLPKPYFLPCVKMDITLAFS